jgi:hypothetical protein
MISEHVLRMHRYLQPGVEEGAASLSPPVVLSCADTLD